MTATAIASQELKWVARLRVASPDSPGTVSELLASRRAFAEHGIEEFEWLARHDPAHLVRLVQGELQTDAVLLSEAAQAMCLGTGQTFTSVLTKLLSHERPFVREAALYGIAPFLSSSLQARDLVRSLSENDPSPGVRAAANDILAAL